MVLISATSPSIKQKPLISKWEVQLSQSKLAKQNQIFKKTTKSYIQAAQFNEETFQEQINFWRRKVKSPF